MRNAGGHGKLSRVPLYFLWKICEKVRESNAKDLYNPG